MWFIRFLYIGQWLWVATVAILITGVIALACRRPIVWGMNRHDWGMLTAISTMSLLSLAFIWLFGYYHWSKGIAFLDQFDPNIDLLKICNMVCGFISIGLATEPFGRKPIRVGILGALAAIPGAISILIYG